MDASAGVETSHGGRALGEWMKRYWAQNISGTGAARDTDLAFLPIRMARLPTEATS